MILHTSLALAVLLAAPPTPDTVVDVARGDRVRLQNLEGRIIVGSWDRSQLRIRVRGRETRVAVVRDGSVVEVSPLDRKGRRPSRSYEVSVPEWMEVAVNGRSVRVEVEGVEAPVSVRTVEGDIFIRRVVGKVSARSVEGEVRVQEVEGDVEAASADEDVILHGVRGRVRVQTVDGDLFLQDVEGEQVEAVNVDGDVSFSGPLLPGGRYHLRTHDGEVTARIAGQPDARVTVSTHDGEFESEFPITLERLRGGQEFHFTLGNGSAELMLAAFDGDIRLVRTSER